MIRRDVTLGLCTFALLIQAAIAAPSQLSNAEVQDQVKSRAAAAAEKLSRQDYKGALTEYDAILQLWPDSPETRANAGLMRHLLGDFAGAVADFEQALRLNPKLEAPTLLCGVDLLALRRPAEAAVYLRRAAKINPHETRATTALGEALFSLGQTDEALANFRTSLQLNPADTEAAYYAGLAYLSIMKGSVEELSEMGPNSVYARILLADAKGAQNRWQDAVKILSDISSTAIATTPCLPALLGFARLHTRELTAAEAEFRKQSSTNVCPLNALGLTRIAFERSDIPAGLKLLEEAWAADPAVVKANAGRLWSGLDDASVTRTRSALANAAAPAASSQTKLMLTSIDPSGSSLVEPVALSANQVSSQGNRDAEALCSSGRYSECAASLRPRLTALSPKQLLLLAQSACYSGDASTTLTAAARVLKTAPADLAALFWEAMAAQRLALGALDLLQRHTPDSPHLHFLIAEMYRQEGNLQAAQREYESILSRGPDDVPAQIGRAQVLVALKDPGATEILKHVLERDPENPEASYLLGSIFVSETRYAEARPFLIAALAGDESYAINAHGLLAHIAYEKNDWREALREIQPCLKHDKDGSYHYRAYQIYKKLGNAPAAADALRTTKLLRRNSATADEQP